MVNQSLSPHHRLEVRSRRKIKFLGQIESIPDLSRVEYDLSVEAEPAEAPEDDPAVADDGAHVGVRLQQESFVDKEVQYWSVKKVTIIDGKIQPSEWGSFSKEETGFKVNRGD